MKEEIAARLSAIRERERAATPGPWEAKGHPGAVGVRLVRGEWLIVADVRPQFAGLTMPQRENVAFISAARTDVPYLLDVAEAAAAFLATWMDDPTGGMADTCDGAAALIEAFKDKR